MVYSENNYDDLLQRPPVTVEKTEEDSIEEIVDEVESRITITSENSGQILQSGSVPFTATTLSQLHPNEDQRSSNFVTGVSGWQIQGNGTVEFADGTFRGTITATAGRIANWYINTNTLSSGAVEGTSNVLIDSANSLMRLGPVATAYITLDGANKKIESSDYVTGVSGFTLQPSLVEAQNIIARGVLSGSTFKYDVISAVGGQLMVSNADTIASDMTALDASPMTIKGNTTFAVNDILVIRSVTALGIQEEWLRVTNIASAPTYTVTRDLAGTYSANTNPIWKAGTPVVKQGVSDGAATYSGGWLRLFGEGTNSPFYSVFARSGIAYNSYVESCRLGNLNGIGGKTSDCYGLFLGNKTTGKYLMYDDVSGDLVINDTTLANQNLFGDGNDGDVTITVNQSLASDMFYNNLTVNAGVNLNTNGYRIFVKGTLTINSSGVIHRDGNNGSNGTDATTWDGPGTGGAGGTALASGSIAGGVAGTNGVDGITGVHVVTSGGSGHNSDGVIGNNGNTGASVGKSLGSAGAPGSAGGAGGDCNYSGLIGIGQAGGNSGSAGSVTGTVFNKPRNYVAAYLLADFFPAFETFTSSASSGGAASGGTGGAACGNTAPVSEAASGASGGAGGSGGVGGIVTVFARNIVNNGTIRANGGNGGNAGATRVSEYVDQGCAGGSGGSSGGAGGTGGVVILVYGTYSGSGTKTVNAGTPGSKASGKPGVGTGGSTFTNGADGSDGGNGNSGVIILLPV